MNLAICAAGELFGGVERQVLDLCDYRISSGFPAPVVILFFDRELADRLRLVGLSPIILKGKNRYDLRMVDQLVGLLGRHEVDVVHVHGYKATITCALAKRKIRFGIVKTEHGKVEFDPRRPVTWLKSRVNFAFEQLFTRKYVDTVCYVTDDIGVFFAQSHRNLNRLTVHNGIAPLSVEDYPRPQDLPSDSINLGIVGRISEVKGIPVALEALKQITGTRKIRLNIIGTGKLSDSLEALAEDSLLADSVHFLGFRRNVYDYLAHLDILLMPSFHEGLPYTLLEAMSLARPVVVSRVGGLPEVISDGRNGLLVPVGDAVSLALAIQGLLVDDDLCMRIGRQAKLDQAEHHTLAKMGQQYDDIYRQSQIVQPNGGKSVG